MAIGRWRSGEGEETRTMRVISTISESSATISRELFLQFLSLSLSVSLTLSWSVLVCMYVCLSFSLPPPYPPSPSSLSISRELFLLFLSLSLSVSLTLSWSVLVCLYVCLSVSPPPPSHPLLPLSLSHNCTPLLLPSFLIYGRHCILCDKLLSLRSVKKKQRSPTTACVASRSVCPVASPASDGQYRTLVGAGGERDKVLVVPPGHFSALRGLVYFSPAGLWVLFADPGKTYL